VADLVVAVAGLVVEAVEVLADLAAVDLVAAGPGEAGNIAAFSSQLSDCFERVQAVMPELEVKSEVSDRVTSYLWFMRSQVPESGSPPRTWGTRDVFKFVEGAFLRRKPEERNTV
jgi:hypothetical protein